MTLCRIPAIATEETVESGGFEGARPSSIAFDTTPESWMNQQAQYDLSKAERKRSKLKRKVKILAAA